MYTVQLSNFNYICLVILIAWCTENELGSTQAGCSLVWFDGWFGKCKQFIFVSPFFFLIKRPNELWNKHVYEYDSTLNERTILVIVLVWRKITIYNSQFTHIHVCWVIRIFICSFYGEFVWFCSIRSFIRW